MTEIILVFIVKHLFEELRHNVLLCHKYDFDVKIIIILDRKLHSHIIANCKKKLNLGTQSLYIKSYKYKYVYFKKIAKSRLY